MAGKYPRNKRMTHSRITGVKFKTQDRTVRNHGPLPRRATYQKCIVEVINSDFMDEWRTTEELAFKATQKVPRHWKQISSFVLGQILRPLIRDGYVSKRKDGNNRALYRRHKLIK